MQITELFATMDWLHEIIPKTFFDLADAVRTAPEAPPQVLRQGILDLAVVQPVIRKNPNAMSVLNAIKIPQITDQETLLGLLATPSEKTPQTRNEILSIVSRLIAGRNYLNYFRPLVIPDDVAHESLNDEILTIQIDPGADTAVTAASLAKLLHNLNELYLATGEILGNSDGQPLQLIFATSGSPVRFDLKGSGDIVKRLKEFVMEAWDRLRFRRQDHLRENNRAALATMVLLKELEQRKRNGDISPEDAARLQNSMISSTISLFESHATLREMPVTETHQTRDLLQEFRMKLLPAPGGDAPPAPLPSVAQIEGGTPVSESPTLIDETPNGPNPLEQDAFSRARPTESERKPRHKKKNQPSKNTEARKKARKKKN